MSGGESSSRKRAPGRPVGGGRNREAILDAARKLFGAQGFDGASLRAIASEAGVDPGLIRHFFGDKQGLFAAMVADRTTIPERLAAAFAGPPDDIGRRIANAYFDVWEDDETGPMVRAMVRTALSSQKSADLVRELIVTRIIGSVDTGGDPELPLRIALVGTHLLGLSAGRYLIGIDPVADVDRDELVRVIAPVLTGYLTGPLG